MSHVARFFLFLLLSIACFVAAGVLTYQQMQAYQQARAVFPAGSTLAEIPVGGLDDDAAQARVRAAYVDTPVEVRVDGSPVQFIPSALGQQVDLDGMLRAWGMIREQQDYWGGLWDYLFNRLPGPVHAPLACAVDEAQLRATLREQLEGRYTQPPTQGQPIAGDVLFRPGQPGQTLNLDAAVEPLKAALCARVERSVAVESQSTGALPPTPDSLEPMLAALAQGSGFDGLIELYYQDLTSGHEVNFAMHQGRLIEPGVAFTAASTIKIPVMISAYKQIDGTLPANIAQQMALMIDLSDNASTDRVMQLALDPNLAPIQVTQDMRALGLQNTFLAGLFYPGAPLLDRFETPANRRGDISTDPDIYNQTTAADMGRLMAAIARCAADGSGPLTTTFGGKITQGECAEMVDLLVKNRKGVLLENGVPDGTRLAHKYGWVTDASDGLMHTASDAAVVYTERGDFVVAVYLYHARQLHWDEAQRLSARLATALSNYYREK